MKYIKYLTKERDALAAVLADIAQVNPDNDSSMGWVVAQSQAALAKHSNLTMPEAV